MTSTILLANLYDTLLYTGYQNIRLSIHRASVGSHWQATCPRPQLRYQMTQSEATRETFQGYKAAPKRFPLNHGGKVADSYAAHIRVTSNASGHAADIPARSVPVLRSVTPFRGGREKRPRLDGGAGKCY